MSGQMPFYKPPMHKQMEMLGTGIHPAPPPRLPEEAQWRQRIEQTATQGSRLISLPPAQDVPRPEGLAMKALRVATYILVIITCLALLFTMFEMYLFIDRMQTALQEWSNTFNTPGLIGE